MIGLTSRCITASLRAAVAAAAILAPMHSLLQTPAGAARDIHAAHTEISKLATQVEDLEATIRVTKYDSVELEKIGADFKATYSLRNLLFQYKQPDKIRIEGRSQTRGGAVLILNGPMRYYEVARLKLHKSENLSAQPGKRQSLLEYAGLISPGTLQFMEGTYVRDEKTGEQSALVYDLHFQGEDRGSFYRVWIDPQTHVTVKREWLDGAGKLRATFLYSEVKELAPNVWLPTKVEIKNAEGGSGAVLVMSDVKLNRGLTDEPFALTP